MPLDLTPIRPMPAGTDELVTRVPAGYLAVALDEVSGPELAARRARLLGALGSARPGEADGALAGVLALAAVIAEQDTRARTYAEHPDRPYRCTCGFGCRGLAAINDHLDESGSQDEDHFEVTETSPARPAP